MTWYSSTVATNVIDKTPFEEAILMRPRLPGRIGESRYVDVAKERIDTRNAIATEAIAFGEDLNGMFPFHRSSGQVVGFATHSAGSMKHYGFISRFNESTMLLPLQSPDEIITYIDVQARDGSLDLTVRSFVVGVVQLLIGTQFISN